MRLDAYLIAAAIAHVEGFYSTKSLAYRHKNPGNLRDSPTTYAVFATIDSGWWHLVEDIQRNEGTRLDKFLAKYAPNTENDTAAYIAEVCALTGYKPESVL